MGRVGVVKANNSSRTGDTLNPFVAQHQAEVIGLLSGFDRLRFKGCLPQLYWPQTMEAYLNVKGLLFKEFKEFALNLTERIKAASLRIAELAGRPFRYLPSCLTRKETLARELIQ